MPPSSGKDNRFLRKRVRVEPFRDGRWSQFTSVTQPEALHTPRSGLVNLTCSEVSLRIVEDEVLRVQSCVDNFPLVRKNSFQRKGRSFVKMITYDLATQLERKSERCWQRRIQPFPSDVHCLVSSEQSILRRSTQPVRIQGLVCQVLFFVFCHFLDLQAQ